MDFRTYIQLFVIEKSIPLEKLAGKKYLCFNIFPLIVTEYIMDISVRDSDKVTKANLAGNRKYVIIVKKISLKI